MTIFDGYAQAQQIEDQLKKRIEELKAEGKKLPTVAAVLFSEDQGSQLYTQFKREAAQRLGIDYQVHEFSIAQHQANDSESPVLARINQLNQDDQVTGIIVQKPWRSTWLKAAAQSNQELSNSEPSVIKSEFDQWWQSLTTSLALEKDVDGLHPQTLLDIENGSWRENHRVLPATCRAVLHILGLTTKNLNELKKTQAKVLILGKSDILGLPLYYVMKNEGLNVESLDSDGFKNRINSGLKLTDADLVITATGQHQLIKGEMLKPMAVVVDVGEPRPDLDVNSLANDPQSQPSLITPVPGGVGPMTVVSLMANAIDLIN